jgi:peptidylprolyl isomerase
MGDVKSIVGVLVGSALLVGGLLYVMGMDRSAPELLLSEDGSPITMDAPLAPEVLEAALEDKAEMATTNDMNPVAVFTTNLGVFEIELFADQMPITTGNFITLAEEGYYNGIKFHRIIDGFMIQGGDPNTKTDNTASYGQGGPGFTIQDEFVAGDNLSNVRGSISMANTGQPNSGGSQFFINTVDNLALDFDKQPFSSKHPVFGKIVKGMDVIDTISSVETGPRDLPVEAVVIESLTIRK